MTFISIEGLTPELVAVLFGALVIVFAMWWLTSIARCTSC